MHFIWSTALKDWRRRAKNPLEILMWVGIPIVIGLVVVLAFGGRGGPKPQAHVLVADNDGGFLSKLLVAALSQEAAGGFIRAESVGEEDGLEQMDNGKATALIVIPEGFSNAVLREDPATLRLVTNPAQRILPGMVEEGLSMLVDGTFYAHRLIGEDLRSFAGGPPDGARTFPDQTIADFSARMNRVADRLAAYLSPPLIQLEAKVDDAEEPVSFGLLLLPSILFMSLLFMAQGLGDDLWEERNRRTLRRVVSSPQPVHAFLMGKLLSGAGLVFVVSLVALAAGYAYLRLRPETLPIAVLWSTAAGTTLAAIMTTIQLFTTSQRAGNILTMAIVFPLMMIGGSFFPFEAMPRWMAAIGRCTPNGWALERLKEIIGHRSDPAGILTAFAIALAVSAALSFISAGKLRRGFAQG
jgi:ABC-type multidrug transport system permease subunit